MATVRITLDEVLGYFDQLEESGDAAGAQTAAALPAAVLSGPHLSEMEALGYLGIVGTSNVGPMWPKVYFVTRRGLTCLKSAFREQGQEWSESRQDRRRSEGSSAPHVLHELFITEFLLLVWEATQSRDDLSLLTTQRRSLAKHNAFKTVVSGRQTHLQPDGMFVCRQEGKGMMCCFVEVDLDTMSLKQMEAKFRRYQQWAESSVGNEYLKGLYQHHGATAATATFRILVVVGSRSCNREKQRLDRLLKLAGKCPPIVRDRIWFSTVGRLQMTAEAGDLLTEPVWLRTRDAVKPHIMFGKC